MLFLDQQKKKKKGGGGMVNIYRKAIMYNQAYDTGNINGEV